MSGSGDDEMEVWASMEREKWDVKVKEDGAVFGTDVVLVERWRIARLWTIIEGET